jgi:hypothetical protein
MRRPLRGVSPAMVVACLALFVALTGTSVAISNALPKNSVGTAQLKNNAVVSSKVKNGSLLKVDFRAGQLPAGPAGVAGPVGPKGEKGDPGATHVVIRTSTETVNPRSSRTFTAFCSQGEVATGGGWRLVGGVPIGSPPVTVLGSVPQSSSAEPSAGETPIGWKVIGVANQDITPHDVTVFAVCASP